MLPHHKYSPARLYLASAQHTCDTDGPGQTGVWFMLGVLVTLGHFCVKSGRMSPTRTAEHLSRNCPGTQCLSLTVLTLTLGVSHEFTPLSYLWCVADMRKNKSRSHLSSSSTVDTGHSGTSKDIQATW